MTLIRSNINLPADEAAHLIPPRRCSPASAQGESGGEEAREQEPEGGECPRDTDHMCLRVTFAMLSGGTMANEIEFCHTLVQWPYLTEMSLISAIINIFLPGWGRPPTGPEAGLLTFAWPWMYINLVLRDSQLYIPVIAPHLRQKELMSRANSLRPSFGPNREPVNMSLSPEKLQELFAGMVAADVADAVRMGMGAAAPEAAAFGPGPVNDGRTYSGGSPRRRSSMGGMGRRGSRHNPDAGSDVSPVARLAPSMSNNWPAGSPSMRKMADMMLLAAAEDPPRLEEVGVVLTMSALRFGYFAGKRAEGTLRCLT